MATTTNDPAIESLDLIGPARSGAYELKRQHQFVVFTSGRRNKADQTRAMASNVVHNRQWIVDTYKASDLRTKCQTWVDDHPEATSQSTIAAGLQSIFNSATTQALGQFSKHLSGEAFDVQPLTKEADKKKAKSVIATIKGLPGLSLFLEKEGGLVRWHAQF